MLRLYCGPVCSGKTMRMLLDAASWSRTRKKVLLVVKKEESPQIEPKVNSRTLGDGRFKTLAFDSIQELVESEAYSVHDFFGIDEVQFFGDAQGLKEVVEDGKVVVVTGLNSDFRMKPWESVSFIQAIAEEVVNLIADCHYCAEQSKFTAAPFSAKIAGSAEKTVEKGKTLYFPVCRKHHKQYSLH